MTGSIDTPLSSSSSSSSSSISQEELEQLKQCLPKSPLMGNTIVQLVNYQGFWFPELYLGPVLQFQRHFQARDTDLIINSFPKTGTTWLKSLLFSTVTRAQHPVNQSPLLKTHPHELVFNHVNDIYGRAFSHPCPEHLDELPSPRLFSTHMSYTSLPESIRASKCRLLYICRNPLDTLVSNFHFATSYLKKGRVGVDSIQLPRFEDLFEDFCEGKYVHGPFFEHVIEYWRMSIEQPDRVLFLKYEDLKDDPALHLKRVAEFVGTPFSPEEENDGVVNQIIQLCSIETMKELEGNKSGVINKYFDKNSYFRKGEVGEWRNHFTHAMAEKITKIMDEKLKELVYLLN